MKKVIALLLAALMVLALFAGCTKKPDETGKTTEKPVKTEEPAETPAATADDSKSEGVMTYAEYDAAQINDAVVIEAYVQAKQSWWDNKAILYLADNDGGYLVYNAACTEEEYNTFTIGTKVKVEGFKGEYQGEIEVAEGAKVTVIEGSTYVAKATDVTALLANEAELIKKMNQFVAFKGMTVEESTDADGNAVAFLYKWNGTGSEGDDLYFKVSVDGATYTFTVESYLCGKDTDVYKAVQALKIGDTVDMEGFLYWYNGVNPHITSVTVTKASDLATKSAGVMTHAEYDAAQENDPVVIEAYIQAKQSWWDNKAILYLADLDGGYLAYNAACTEDEYNNNLTIGTKVKVEGYKASYRGEIEVAEGATVTVVEGAGKYIAKAKDVTALLANEEELIKNMNRFVAFKGMTVEASTDADGNAVPFLYKWNGTGGEGDDLYFKVSVDGATYTFTVESYLCGKDTDVYKAVQGLTIGDKIDMEGFLYWYDGVNPHITSVTKV